MTHVWWCSWPLVHLFQGMLLCLLCLTVCLIFSDVSGVSAPGPDTHWFLVAQLRDEYFAIKWIENQAFWTEKIGRNLSLIDIFSHFLPAISAKYYPPGSSDWRLRSFVSPSIPGSWLLAHHVSWGKGQTRKVLLEILLRCWNITPSQSYNQFPNHGTKYLASD